MKFSCNSSKVDKVTYIVHLSHILQDEANNFCSSCIDVFVPYKGHIFGERFYVPGKKKKETHGKITDTLQDLNYNTNEVINVLLLTWVLKQLTCISLWSYGFKHLSGDSV